MNDIIPLTAAERERLIPSRRTLLKRMKSATIIFVNWPISYKLIVFSLMLMAWMECVDAYFSYFKH
jgi:hypothetical protein